MSPGPFVFHRLATVGDAVQLLATLDGEARPRARGLSLVPKMKLMLATPDRQRERARRCGYRLDLRRAIHSDISDGAGPVSPVVRQHTIKPLRLVIHLDAFVSPNPMMGWASYRAEVAGIRAVLPKINLHLSTNKLRSLARLESCRRRRM